ncbi:unnamed protein product [Phaeothamnion confervicola]
MTGDESDVDEEERATASAIRKKQALHKVQRRLKASRNSAIMPRGVGSRGRSLGGAVAHLESLGVDASAIEAREMRRAAGEVARKRGRSMSRRRGGSDAGSYGDRGGDDAMNVDGEGGGRGREREKRRRGEDGGDASLVRSASRSRSRAPSKPRTPQDMGLKDAEQVAKTRKMSKVAVRTRNRMARAGESDRKEGPKLTKHLLQGKMGLGTRRSR